MKQKQLPRYLRFARVLALTSGVLPLGCSSAVIPFNDDASITDPQDSASETSVDVAQELGVDIVDVPPVFGICTSWVGNRQCEAGRVCAWDGFSGSTTCLPGVEGSIPTCGVISCGSACTCENAQTSTCRCSGFVQGPLPPPDFPV